jgi:hypothetical protein
VKTARQTKYVPGFKHQHYYNNPHGFIEVLAPCRSDETSTISGASGAPHARADCGAPSRPRGRLRGAGSCDRVCLCHLRHYSSSYTHNNSIVALHGLNGHRGKTWTAENGTHWLRDLLPEDLPHARILCWGYDANTHAAEGVSWKYLYDHAIALVSDLCRKRQMTNVSARRLHFVLVLTSYLVCQPTHHLRRSQPGRARPQECTTARQPTRGNVC